MAEWDVIRREGADSPAPEPQRANAAADPWAVVEKAPAPVAGRRTISEWMSDAGSRIGQTTRDVTGAITGLPTNLLNQSMAMPRMSRDAGDALRSMVGLDPIDNAITRFFDVRQQPEAVQGIRESLEIDNAAARASMTPQAQALSAGLEETDGFVDTLSYLMSNPGFAAQEVVAQLPQLLQMVPGSLPGTIAAQMGGIGSQAEQQVVREAEQRGQSPQEAAERGATAFGLTAPIGAIPALIPGGLAVERLITGGAARPVASRIAAGATALGGETATELVQEWLEQVAQNYALDDPLGEGVGSAAAQGAVLGAGMGAPAGIATAALARPQQQAGGEWDVVDTAPAGDAAETSFTPAELASVRDELRRKRDGTPDTERVDDDGKTRRVRGEQPQFLSDQEKAALERLEQMPDLTPREPAPAAVPEGATRESLVEAWRAAATPEEKTAIAGQIAALDAQEQARGQTEETVFDVPEGAPRAEAPGREDRGQDQPQAEGVRDAEQIADGEGVGSAGGPALRGAQGQARVDQEPGAVSDPADAQPRSLQAQAAPVVEEQGDGSSGADYADTTDPGIQRALGEAAKGVTVLRNPGDLKPEDRSRLTLDRDENADVEGIYDPDTGRVFIFEERLTPPTVSGMTRAQRKVWVAAHERSGHAGLRGMFADAAGSNTAGSQQLVATLNRAQNNPTVAAIVTAMQGQRPERGAAITEEAIVELAAAVRTGNFRHLKDRYGVDVTPQQQSAVRDFINRIVAAIRRALNLTDSVPDGEVFKLIEDANRYAQRGEVRGTSPRSERSAPVAQRAFHGTPQRGIERFSLDKIGSGEGNQAFGWGMYFAGNKDIADSYRRGLSAIGRRPGGTLADALIQKQGSSRGALEVLARMRRGTLEQGERVSGRIWQDKDAMLREIAGAEQFIRADNNRGQTYQQELPEDSELLDWDAPLSEQPPAVREAIESLGEVSNRSGQNMLERDPLGQELYRALESNLGTDQQASEALGAAGIPGLRYRAGDNARQSHNYVIWDESRIGAPEALIASRAARLLRNLTPAEQKKVTDKVAAKIEAQLTKLPPKREMAAIAQAGRAKRGWYAQSAQTISSVFGADAPLFAGLLAALSPQISVEGNLKNALNVWRDWVAAGRPVDADEIKSVMRDSLRRTFGNSLPSWEPNAVRALQGQGMLSGPKVDSFMKNLLGDVEEVTNDAWMANYSLVNQTIFKGGMTKSGTDPGKGTGYLAMNARVRETARELTRLTGETWTPAEVQETIWSWAKTITEMADSGTEIRSAEELVLDRAVSDELIASTPDFGTLFTMPEYRQILEEAGYGDQLNEVDAQRDAAGAARQEPGARSEAVPFAPEDQLRFERQAARRIDQLRAQRRESTEEVEAEEVPFSRSQGKYDPLPGAPKVKGATGPTPKLVRVAEQYAKKHGIELVRQGQYVKADPERGARIAAAYEAMEHAPNDPRVQKAYAELIAQTTAQYRALEDAGYSFWFIDPSNDPYGGNPWNAMRELRSKQAMGVFPSSEGFGSSDLDTSDNPLLADTGMRWPYGSPDGELRPVLANDLFRAVHDAFGHGLEGAGFRADGEENAWQAHVRLFTGDAVGAITSETRGQNSYLNFGPNGEANRTASAEDTVFADQKTGLMPEWTWEEGRAGDEAPVASRGFSAKPRQPDAVSADAYHYSNTAGLKSLDPKRAGSNAAGRERRRFGMGTFGERGGSAARLGFYVSEDGSVPTAEPMVRSDNVYRVQLDNLYDLDADPRGFVDEAGQNVDLMEELISDAGFDGFLSPPVSGIDVPTAVVFDIGNKKIPVEAVEAELVASRMTPQMAQQQRAQAMTQLQAQGYAIGTPLQPQPGGRFDTVKKTTDRVRTKLQDKMLPLLRAQENAVGQGGAAAVSTITLDDTMNAYRGETLMHGRVTDSLNSVQQRLIQPMQDALRKSGFSLDMLEDYLYAKAAPERNAHIATINKEMPDSGSGISTQLARDILAGRADGVYSGKKLSSEAIKVFQSIEPLVRKMIDEKLQNMVDAGRITQQMATDIKARYPNYIPMRGKDDLLDDGSTGAPGGGRGISQSKSKPWQRAMGRGDQNIPVNIMGEVVGDLQRSIVDREKGRVVKQFLRFALANPQPDLYAVEPVDLEWKFSEATGEVYLGVKRRGEDVDSTLVSQHDGKPVLIRVNDPQLQQALLNVNANDMGKILRIIGFINRWRSAVLTRYNPAFAPVNMLRDLQFGLVAVAAEHGTLSAVKVAGHYTPALAAAYRHASNQRGDASVPDAQKSYDDWAAEFYAQGGSTGITRVDDVIDLQKKLSVASTSLMALAAQGRIGRAGWESVVRVGKPIIDVIENANEATENAIRMASYIEQRKRGVSKPKAAEYAKNVTINFNRKGEWGSVANAVFLFYNAAMQGGHAVLRVMKNPKVMAYLAGLASLQAVLATHFMDDDDDDGITTWDAIPDYVKRTSLVIPVGSEGRYFALPMPYGFNFFPYLGGRISQRRELGDRPNDSSIPIDLLKSLTEAFSPIPFQDGYGSLFGDQMGFLMGLAANTDDFGTPITQDSYKQYEEPMATLGKVDTPRPYHAAAQLMAKIGGGDLDERIPPVGYLDVAPEQLEAMVNYMGGGVTSFAGRGLRWWEQMNAGNLEGSYDAVRQLPIMSRFIGEANFSRAIAERYYNERGEFQRHKDLFNEELSKGVPFDEAMASRGDNEYMAGTDVQRRKTSGRDPKTRERRLRGDVIMRDGVPATVVADGYPADVMRKTDTAVKGANSAIRTLRVPGVTNAEVVSMLEGYGLSATDLGLPAAYNDGAEAPNRIRTRAIKLIQDARAELQQRPLTALENERRLRSVRE